MPYTDEQVEKFIAIPNLFITKALPYLKQNNYITLKFTKSNRKTTYTRSFNKIDNYFSYIGGLVGTILLIFFLIQKYSETAYLIDISSEITITDD